jgi:hypothetical protein
LFAADSAYDNSIITNGDLTILEGLKGTSPSGNPKDPNFIKFQTNYKAYVGTTPAPNAEAGYDAVYIFAMRR